MGKSIQNLSCEAVGTFALTFIGAGAILTTIWTGGQPGLVGIAFAHGLALSIAVTATMNISGGHINPAVTLAMMVTGRMKPVGAVAYIIAQCVGATAAGFLLAGIFQNLGAGAGGVTGQEAVETCKLGTPFFGEAVSPALAMIVEIALTFLLLFAVFGTAVDQRAPKIGGFGIGLTVCFDILMGGPITGAAMNPARAIGTLIAGGTATSSLWSQHWVYWVGPVVGAVFAAVFYDRVILDHTSNA